MDQPTQTDAQGASNLPPPLNPPSGRGENVPAPIAGMPSITPATPAKAGGSKIGLIVGAVLAVVVIAAAGAYAYTTFVAQAPEKVLSKMLAAMENVDTMKFNAEWSMEIKSVDTGDEEAFASEAFIPGLETGKFVFMMSGAMDATDLENQKTELVMSLDVTPGEKTEDVKELVQGLNDLELDIRVMDKKIYLMGKNLPSTPEMDLSFLSDQWILFDTEEFMNELGLGDLTAAEDEEKTAYELTEEQSRQVAGALFDSGLLEITGKLPSEKIGDEKCLHVAYQINLVNLENFMLEWNDIVPQNPIGKDEMDAILSETEDMTELDENGDMPLVLQGEVWVGTKTSYLRKFTFTPVFSEATLADMRDEGKDMSFSFGMTLSGFNEPVKIDEPENAKSFMDLMDEMMAEMTLDSDYDGLADVDEEAAGTDPYVMDTDGDGVMDGDEWLYGSDPLLFDTDGDGYSDGAEVDSGYNPAGEGLLEYDPYAEYDWGEDWDTSGDEMSGFDDSTLDSYDPSLDLNDMLVQ